MPLGHYSGGLCSTFIYIFLLFRHSSRPNSGFSNKQKQAVANYTFAGAASPSEYKNMAAANCGVCEISPVSGTIRQNSCILRHYNYTPSISTCATISIIPYMVSETGDRRDVANNTLIILFQVQHHHQKFDKCMTIYLIF